jgi:hypothetical protein
MEANRVVKLFGWLRVTASRVMPFSFTRAGFSPVHRFSQLFWLALSVLAFSIPAFAQHFVVGVKAGVPITEYFQTGSQGGYRYGFEQSSSATRRYIVGFSWEWRTRHSYGIEVDALYTRVGYSDREDYVLQPVSWRAFSDLRGHSWDIPMLFKYRFGRPNGLFVCGGYSFRHVGPVRLHETVIDIYQLPSEHTEIRQYDYNETGDLPGNFSGLSVGAGVEVGKGWFRVAPELRYTHWVSNFANNALKLSPNQVEFFLGFSPHR